jgi:hypothetical protein
VTGERIRRFFAPNDEQREVLSRRGDQVKQAGKLVGRFLFGSDAEASRVVQEIGSDAEQLVRDLRGGTAARELEPKPEARGDSAWTGRATPSSSSASGAREDDDAPLAEAEQLVWCRGCGREQGVPTEVALDRTLRAFGWVAEAGGWRCPTCAPGVRR